MFVDPQLFAVSAQLVLRELITPSLSMPLMFNDRLPRSDLLAQRVRFPFDVKFTSSALALYPAKGNPPVGELLNGSVTVLGTAFTASTLLQLLFGANPYFANVDPNQGNVSWLSQGLRVFTATPSVNNTPVPGGPVFGADGFDGAYTYIQALLAYLNANFSNPAGVDPFSAASDVIPQQTGAYTVIFGHAFDEFT